MDKSRTPNLIDSVQRMNSENLRFVTDALSAGICRCRVDEKFSLVFANEFFYSIAGYTEATAREAGFDSITFVIYPPDLHIMFDLLKYNIKRGISRFEFEARVVSITGELIWILSRCNYNPASAEITSVVFDITDRKQVEEKLRVSEEEYRIASSQSGKLILRYDPKTKTIVHQFDSEAFLGLPREIGHMPDSLLARRIISNESTDEFARFFEAMRRGEESGSAIVHMMKADGQYSWFHMDFTMIYTKSGAPLHAIVSFYDVTDLHEKELAYERLQQSFASLQQDSIMYYQFNLSKATCEREEGGLVVHFAASMRADLDAMLDYSTRHFVYPEDRELYRNFMSRIRLLGSFLGGVREEQLEYRTLAKDGSALWAQATIQMVADPYSGDIKAFVMFVNIHAKKTAELAMKAMSQEDPLTGLLNRNAFIAQFKALLEQREAGYNHALIIIDIDYFKQVNDKLGHMLGDRLLIDIATNLRSLMRTGDIIGRLGGDEFIICLKNIPYDDVLEKRAEFICQLLQRELSPEVQVSGSLGIAMYPRDGTTFEELYQNADTALYEAKEQGRNRYIFFRANMKDSEWDPIATPIDGMDDMIAADDFQRQAAEKIRRQNKAVLRRQSDDERFRIIIEQAKSAIFEWNFEDHSFYSSEYFGEYVIGQQDSDLLLKNQGDAEAVHPDDREILQNTLFKPLQDGAPRAEVTLRLLKTDGSYIWCRLTAVCIRSHEGKLRRALGMITEVDMVRENANIQLQALMNYMAGGVLLIEVRDRLMLLYVSPSFYSSTGRKREDVNEEGWSLLKMIHPEDRPAVESSLKQGAKHGNVMDMVYRAILTEDQTDKWRHIRAVRIPYEGSEYPVMIAVVTDVTDLKLREMELKLGQQQLQMAFELSSLAMYECDIHQRTVTLFATAKRRFNSERTTVENIPESFIASGFIHPDSADDIRAFYKDVFSGKPEGVCFVKARKSNGQYGLGKTSFKMVYDDKGQPYKAVCISEEVEDIAHSRQRFEQEEQLYKLINDDVICVCRANLSRGHLEYLWVKGFSKEETSQMNTYAAAYKVGCSLVPNAEERANIKERFSPEALKKAYQENRRFVNAEFRRNGLNDRLVWSSVSIRLMNNPGNGDLYAFAYLRNINTSKKLELACSSKIERDPLSGMYTRGTLKALVNLALANNADTDRLCALLVLQGSELKKIKEYFGQKALDRVILNISRQLHMCLENENLIGLLGPETCAIFLPHTPSAEWARETARYLLISLKQNALFASTDNQFSSYSFGVFVMEAGSASFDRLYEEAVNDMAATSDPHTIYAMLSEGAAETHAARHHRRRQRIRRATQSWRRRRNKHSNELNLDPLTGVLSRNSFVELLQKTAPETYSALGVLITDVNGLKNINSKYGNRFGDGIIIHTAQVLRRYFNSDEVFRYSGGSFLVLCRDISHDAFADHAETIRASFFNREQPGSMAIGYTWTDDVKSIEKLVSQAEELMLADKHEYYHTADAEEQKDLMHQNMRSELLEHIEKGWFRLYLQPKIDIRNNMIGGAETLVRTIHPVHGLIMPDKFIPVLEKTGLVSYLDFYILEETLKIMEKWLLKSPIRFPVSLNFSRSTMLQPNVIDFVTEITSRYNVPHELLEFEITESLGDLERETITRIGNNILEAGFRLSLDDFGAQYSNLSILSSMALSALKLDKSLIDRVVSNERSREVVQSVIRLCERLEIECVAEGVETMEQLERLREMGCSYVQGYYFDKPLPVTEFEKVYIGG